MIVDGAKKFPASRVVQLARGWIGTPYHHQASCRGVGTDCLGLVRGVWRELYGFDVEQPPAYARDWAEARGDETMLAGARRYLSEVSHDELSEGKVLVFRYRQGMVAKHAGIVSGSHKFIHAMEGVPVCEVALSSWWRRRVVSSFKFPGVTS